MINGIVNPNKYENTKNFQFEVMFLNSDNHIKTFFK